MDCPPCESEGNEGSGAIRDWLRNLDGLEPIQEVEENEGSHKEKSGSEGETLTPSTTLGTEPLNFDDTPEEEDYADMIFHVNVNKVMMTNILHRIYGELMGDGLRPEEVIEVKERIINAKGKNTKNEGGEKKTKKKKKKGKRLRLDTFELDENAPGVELGEQWMDEYMELEIDQTLNYLKDAFWSDALLDYKYPTGYVVAIDGDKPIPPFDMVTASLMDVYEKHAAKYDGNSSNAKKPVKVDLYPLPMKNTLVKRCQRFFIASQLIHWDGLALLLFSRTFRATTLILEELDWKCLLLNLRAKFGVLELIGRFLRPNYKNLLIKLFEDLQIEKKLGGNSLATIINGWKEYRQYMAKDDQKRLQGDELYYHCHYLGLDGLVKRIKRPYTPIMRSELMESDFGGKDPRLVNFQAIDPNEPDSERDTCEQCTGLGERCNCSFEENFPETRVYLAETENNGIGVKCLESIPAEQFIAEYAGVIRREHRVEGPFVWAGLADPYAVSGHLSYQHKYAYYITSREKGNWTRFINHSCEPNCTLSTIMSRGRVIVVIRALREISIYEELTISYDSSYFFARGQECRCGKRCCRASGEDFPATVEQWIDAVNAEYGALEGEGLDAVSDGVFTESEPEFESEEEESSDSIIEEDEEDAYDDEAAPKTEIGKDNKDEWYEAHSEKGVSKGDMAPGNLKKEDSQKEVASEMLCGDAGKSAPGTSIEKAEEDAPPKLTKRQKQKLRNEARAAEKSQMKAEEERRKDENKDKNSRRKEKQKHKKKQKQKLKNDEPATENKEKAILEDPTGAASKEDDISQAADQENERAPQAADGNEDESTAGYPPGETSKDDSISKAMCQDNVKVELAPQAGGNAEFEAAPGYTIGEGIKDDDILQSTDDTGDDGGEATPGYSMGETSNDDEIPQAAIQEDSNDELIPQSADDADGEETPGYNSMGETSNDDEIPQAAIQEDNKDELIPQSADDADGEETPGYSMVEASNGDEIPQAAIQEDSNDEVTPQSADDADGEKTPEYSMAETGNDDEIPQAAIEEDSKSEFAPQSADDADGEETPGETSNDDEISQSANEEVNKSELAPQAADDTEGQAIAENPVGESGRGEYIPQAPYQEDQNDVLAPESGNDAQAEAARAPIGEARESETPQTAHQEENQDELTRRTTDDNQDEAAPRYPIRETRKTKDAATQTGHKEEDENECVPSEEGQSKGLFEDEFEAKWGHLRRSKSWPGSWPSPLPEGNPDPDEMAEVSE
ncbi:hypothetical protein RUND412_000296 [Rhizina undulata]